MRLLPATLALAGTLLAMPLSASAEGRMCMMVPEASILDATASFFDPPTSLSPTAPRADAAPTETESVLWCQSADDPRCMPVHRDSEGTTEIGTAPLRSPGPASVDVAASSATEVRFLADETHPLRGVRRRIDRPPRA